IVYLTRPAAHTSTPVPYTTLFRSDREHQLVALLLGPVTDALELQALFKPLGDPLHHVDHQRAGQPVNGPMALQVTGTGHHHLAVFHLNADLGEQGLLQTTLRSFHHHAVVAHLHRHTGGNGNRPPTDARHGLTPSSPDVAEDFPADAFPARLPVGHHPAGGGQDSHPESSQHLRNLVAAGVHPAPRLADALQSRHDPLLIGAVLE